jgi:hypothetical protein
MPELLEGLKRTIPDLSVPGLDRSMGLAEQRLNPRQEVRSGRQ